MHLEDENDVLSNLKEVRTPSKFTIDCVLLQILKHSRVHVSLLVSGITIRLTDL